MSDKYPISKILLTLSLTAPVDIKLWEISSLFPSKTTSLTRFSLPTKDNNNIYINNYSVVEIGGYSTGMRLNPPYKSLNCESNMDN